MTVPDWRPVDASPFIRRRNRCWTMLAVMTTVAVLLAILVASFAACIVAMLVLTPLASLLLRRAERHDEHAKVATLLDDINEQLRSNRPYILFLRSFSSTLRRERTHFVVERDVEEMKMIRGEMIATGRRRRSREERFDFDDDLLTVLTRLFGDVPVIAIDGRPAQISARPLVLLSEDAHWRRMFELLAANARGIVILPEPTDSLKQEIAAALEHHRDKLAFVMPGSRSAYPENADGSVRSATLVGAARQQRWNSIRAHVEVDLPPFSEAGAFLHFVGGSSRLDPVALSTAGAKEILAKAVPSARPLKQAFSELCAHGLLDAFFAELDRRTRLVPGATGGLARGGPQPSGVS